MGSPFDPVYSHNGTFDDNWNTRPVRRSYKMVSSMLRDNPAEQLYRTRAYQDIGGQLQAGESALRANSASAFGMNNPSGITGALMARNYITAPYGTADMGAIEAGRRSDIGTMSALLDFKQRHANWYATLKNVRLAYENMKIQEDIAKANAAASAAAASAGG